MRFSDDGYLYSTLFVEAGMRDKMLNPLPHKAGRFEMFARLGNELPVEPDIAHMRSLISNREGKYPINDPQKPIAVSLLGSCRDRFMDVAFGRPDEEEFKRYYCGRPTSRGSMRIAG